MKRPRRWGRRRGRGGFGVVDRSYGDVGPPQEGPPRAFCLRLEDGAGVARAAARPGCRRPVYSGMPLERRAGELIYEARDLEDRPKVVRRYATGPEVAAGA